MSNSAQSPRLPLAFKLKAFLRTVPPLLKTGAFYFPLPHNPKGSLEMLRSLYRWRFAVGSLVHLDAQRYPDRLALVDDDGELTYRELDEMCTRVVLALMARGMSRDTKFGIIARNGRGIIVPMAVKGLIGSEIMLMNVGSSEAQVDGIVEQNDVSFMFIDDEFIDRIPKGRKDLNVVITHVSDPETRNKVPSHWLFMEDLAKETNNGTFDDFEFKPEQGRIIIMSSGTTGLPKGVLRDEPKLPNSVGAICERIPWRRNMVVHQSASMFHAWGWANVLIAFGTGATIVTMRQFDGKKMAQQCQQYGVNGIISAAFFLRQFKDELDDNPVYKLGPFKFIVSSGNAIPAWLVRALTHRFGPVVCNFYGSTEAGLTSIATGQDLTTRPDSAGRPAMSAIVRIYDDNGKELPAGKVGRIFACEDSSFTGYLNPEDKFNTIDGLFEIGDRGYLDREGYLYISGRSDDMVIKGGENVFPREVEELVGGLPGIADCYCRGVQNDEIIADLYLYVVRSGSKVSEDLTQEYLQKYVRENLADHSVPDKVIFVDMLPRNAVGKVVPREIDAMLGKH